MTQKQHLVKNRVPYPRNIDSVSVDEWPPLEQRMMLWMSFLGNQAMQTRGLSLFAEESKGVMTYDDSRLCHRTI